MPYRTRKSAFVRTLFAAPLLRAVLLSGFLVLSFAGCGKGSASSVPTMLGNTVDLAGPEWLVVNYWAEWCGPCRHEIPELNELDGAAALADTAVSVLGVNYDGLVDKKLVEVSERMGISFAVLATDPRERWGQPVPTVLPSTYLIAPGGDFVETLVGPQTRAGIISRIETLAAARK